LYVLVWLFWSFVFRLYF